MAEWHGLDYVRDPEVIERVYERLDADGEIAAQLEGEQVVAEIFGSAPMSGNGPFV